MTALDKFLRLAGPPKGSPMKGMAGHMPSDTDADGDTDAQDLEDIISAMADLSDADLKRLDTACDEEMATRGLPD